MSPPPSSTPAPPSAPAAQLLPTASGAQLRHHLGRVLRDRRGMLAAATAAMAADSALGLVGPLAIGQITQAIAEGRHLAALVAPVALLTAAALAAGLTTWGAAVGLAKVVLPAVARLREDALAAATRLPIDAVEAGGAGDLVSRLSGDVERVSDVAEGALGNFLGAGLTILGTLVGLAGLDWRFALAGLLAVPIQAHTLRWYLRISRPIYAGGRRADGRRAAALLAGFTALPTLRALRLGDRQRDRIAEASEESVDYELRAIHEATRFFGRLNLAEVVGLGAILLVAFVLVRNGLASIGAATAAALLFAGLFDPINTVLGVFDSIQQAGAGLARLVGVTLAAPPPRDRPAGEPAGGAPSALRGTLRAEGVCFAYRGGPQVLHDVSLEVRAGRCLAIVGATGSGKSTLASLLAGLRGAPTGSVTLDGIPIDQLDPAGRHRLIALVTQETHVFTGSVADNLHLAAPGASRERLAAALETVGASWIDTLPGGLDGEIGTGEVLTPSQVQQLALARLVVADPPVVILDEATAEGGSDAARTLDQAAAAVLQGRTAVVVVHRLSQARAADTIAVMEAGRIVEHGSHAQLVAAAGRYARLWSAWAGSDASSPAPAGS